MELLNNLCVLSDKGKSLSQWSQDHRDNKISFFLRVLCELCEKFLEIFLSEYDLSYIFISYYFRCVYVEVELFSCLSGKGQSFLSSHIRHCGFLALHRTLP